MQQNLAVQIKSIIGLDIRAQWCEFVPLVLE